MKLAVDFCGGETGIRTLGPPKEVNGFRDRPDRPLRHLSVVSNDLGRITTTSILRFRFAKIQTFSDIQKKLTPIAKKIVFLHFITLHTRIYII